MLEKDEVVLSFNGGRIENFSSYSIDSDLNFAACAFSLELSRLEMERKNMPIKVGMQCKILINGRTELTGQIDKIENTYEKNARGLKVSGRDLMGILVDACAGLEDGESLEGFTLVEAAQWLTKKLTFAQRKVFVLQSDCGGLDRPIGMLQVEPGMKIFEILCRYASMCGLIFYGLPDGTMVFGKPKAKRFVNDPHYSLVCRKDGAGNNIISGRLIEDISKAASVVSVVSQCTGGGGELADVSASMKNHDFPADVNKPLTLVQNGDEDSPAALAKLTVEKMRRESFTLEYVVAGHSQNCENWRINRFAQVTDQLLGIYGEYLIESRTFTRSKDEGTKTTLRLSKGGLA
jgi:prophage tail gpP-like protein